jgi:hypothetical protein
MVSLAETPTTADRLELQKLYSKAAIAQLNAERAKGAYLARVEEMRRACVASGGDFTLQDDGDVRCEVKPEKK